MTERTKRVTINVENRFATAVGKDGETYTVVAEEIPLETLVLAGLAEIARRVTLSTQPENLLAAYRAGQTSRGRLRTATPRPLSALQRATARIVCDVLIGERRQAAGGKLNPQQHQALRAEAERDAEALVRGTALKARDLQKLVNAAAWNGEPAPLLIALRGKQEAATTAPAALAEAAE